MGASAKTNLKRVGLELGGKSPIAIFDDVDCKFTINLIASSVLCLPLITIFLSVVDQFKL